MVQAGDQLPVARGASAPRARGPRRRRVGQPRGAPRPPRPPPRRRRGRAARAPVRSCGRCRRHRASGRRDGPAQPPRPPPRRPWPLGARPGRPRRASPAGPCCPLRRGSAWRRTLLLDVRAPHGGDRGLLRDAVVVGPRGPRWPPGAPSVGCGDYVYAPKDDPKHRERWRDPYDDDELTGFAGVRGRRRAAPRVRHLPRPLDGPGLRLRPPGPGGQGRPGGRGRGDVGGARPRRHPLRRRPPGPGPRRAHRLAPRPPRRPGRAQPGADRVRRHRPLSLPRRPRRGRAVGGADRVDGTSRGQRHDHGRRRGGPGRVARRPSPARLGQLPGQRRPHGRPPLPRSPARP